MAKFTPRTEAPASNNSYYYANNPFYASGYGIPNCTCYAWGRFWECQGSEGSRPTLALHNAEDWYNYSDGYSRGQTPKVGAVICWRKGNLWDDSDGAGHVGIVEAVYDDGTILTSESAYNGYTFRTKHRNPTWNWDGGDYVFQGFIYNPVTFDGSGSSGGSGGGESGGDEPGGETPVVPPDTPIPPDTPVLPIPTPVTGAQNRYLTFSEKRQNARYIWWYLSQRGWTLNAVAGMLGNIEVESSINPFIWQNLDEGNLDGGFGLVQWTPATKLTNWCSNNGLVYWEMDSQLKRLIWEQENENGQFYSADTPYAGMTFTDFKNSTKEPYSLGMIFLRCYERPADPNQPSRGENAQYWYNYLSSIVFEDGEGGGDNPANKRKGLPLWLMYVATRRRV